MDGATQAELGQVLNGLLLDLREVIPEHEVVLSLSAATCAAVRRRTPAQALPRHVDGEVRSIWGMSLPQHLAEEMAEQQWEPAGAVSPAGQDCDVGLVQIGADLRIRGMDHQAAALLGLPHGRLAGTPASARIAPADRLAVEESLRRLAADSCGPDRGWAQIVAVLDASGVARPMLLMAASLSGTSPPVIACAVTAMPVPDPAPGTADTGRPGSDHRHSAHGGAVRVEFRIEEGAGSPSVVPAIAARLQRVLGDGARVSVDTGQITTVVPGVPDPLAGIGHGERIQRLLERLCAERGMPEPQVHTELLCFGPQGAVADLLAPCPGHDVAPRQQPTAQPAGDPAML